MSFFCTHFGPFRSGVAKVDKFLEKGNLKTHLTLTQIGLGVAHVLQQYVVEPVL